MKLFESTSYRAGEMAWGLKHGQLLQTAWVWFPAPFRQLIILTLILEACYVIFWPPWVSLLCTYIHTYTHAHKIHKCFFKLFYDLEIVSLEIGE